MMRKTTLLITLCLCAVASQAQYKKASFNTKRAISMELTGRASFISKSNMVQPAIAFSLGREKDASRYFSWHDFEIVLPANYSYSTTNYDYNSGEPQKVTVEAKALGGFQYRFNSGIFLVNNGNEDNKVLPFVNFGASIMFHIGSSENYDSYYYDLTTEPSDVDAYVGMSGGVGVIYKITKAIGIKATGGYSLMGSASAIDDSGVYNFYKSHPYVTFGFRFLISRGGD